ncbi:MAG: dihydrolipoyl dehydrogenase [Nitrospinae bacterium]|nr:dihydrolipoyl dehydrogenase [Nitrospinota bacterium]
MSSNRLTFDVVVIGAGPAGYTTAISLAQQGKKVVCIDENNCGGECLNHGCIPSKAFLNAAKAYYSLDEMKAFGVNVSKKDFDMKALQDWKGRRVVKKLTSGINFLFKTKNVEYLKGKAFFIDKNTIRVMSAENGMIDIQTSYAVIAVGSKFKTVSDLEPDGKTIFSPKEILEIDFIPETVTILGGGYIGFELGFFYLYLGKKVTVIESMKTILGELDEDLRILVQDSFKKLGGEIHTSSTFKEFKNSQVTFAVGGEDKQIDSQIILVSVGKEWDFKPLRIHKLDNLRLNENGSIAVKETLETSITGVYAVGDCNGGPLLAHKAIMEGTVAAESIATIGNKPSRKRLIPYTVFSEPEIAYVGMTEKQAISKGINYHLGIFPNSALGINNIIGNKIGFTKIIVKESDSTIIGAKVAGKNASILIGELTLAIQKKLKADELGKIIHVHPSQAEAIQESALSALKQSIHY